MQALTGLCVWEINFMIKLQNHKITTLIYCGFYILYMLLSKHSKQVCVDPLRVTALTLPAAQLVEAAANHARRRCCRSTGQTDGRTDGHRTVTQTLTARSDLRQQAKLQTDCDSCHDHEWHGTTLKWWEVILQICCIHNTAVMLV